MNDQDGNGAAPESRAQRIAQLGRELADLIAEWETLAAGTAEQQEHQDRLEVIASEAEDDRQDRDRGILWLR